MKKVSRNHSRKRRKRRVNVKGTLKVPRFVVSRSNKRVYVQLVNDTENKVLKGIISPVSDKESNKSDQAYKVGELIAKEAKKLKIKRAVFDRNGYKFHGRVKSAMEGAIKEGLNFKK